MNRQTTGKNGEHHARIYLEARGYRVVAANWRSGRYEIDLVAEAPPGPWPVLAVVEVKTRHSGPHFDAHAARGWGQRRRLVAAARAFVQSHPDFEKHHVRFDAVLVLASTLNPSPDVLHLPGAFRAE